MKHRLFSLLLAGIMGVLAVHAQTDYAKLGINRRVLFTMNKNEVCDYVSTRNLSKGVDECRFYLLVIDTITDIKTDVYNGKRRFTSTVDYEPGETEDCHSYYGFSTQAFGYYTNDSTLTREDVIVSYKRGKDEYLVVGNETYGPFMDVCSDYSERRKEYITGMELHPQLKCSFHYQSKVDSLWYQHDADGMEYLLGDGDGTEPMGRTFFQSPNKKHSLRLSADIYKVRLDDKSYQLDSLLDKDPTFAEAYVFDDGSCFISYKVFWADFAGYYKSTYGSYFITTNGEVKTVSRNQYIDIKDMSIKDPTSDESEEARTCPLPENTRRWDCEYYTCPEEYDKYGYRNNLYYERKAKITSLDSHLYYIFDDKQHKHHFLTVRGSGTIYIDGMVLKADYPMLASYNEDANCFRWVVVEGKDIVYYSYLLQ
jgi:hypothetical protein